jgi:hypothetical protein
MANSDLKRDPHKIDENTWWYEEPRGLEIILHDADMDSRRISIPWRAIRNALKRKDKPKEKP